ncbi:MAG: Natural resistance-associated macrophage protein [Microgenomates group bacterium GW2011_GWB1_44_8]|nr:MAG: Natural resistance-associated macrophage protein [Microgenomates group bacterium GW2011_GWB1_44_8]
MLLIRKLNKFLKILGPGFITGAADDDPSGIATYSQTGAQFGFGQLWTALFMLPLQVAVQEACARIGAVTGKGISAVIREHFSKKILFVVVLLVLIANTINIGADIGAMAAAAGLIIPMNFTLLALLFTAIILGLEIFTSYKRYARVLKWLTLSLIAYPITVLIVNQQWITILKSSIFPHFELSFDFLFVITAVLGTTISPYMFFWQASEETEEERAKHLLVRDNQPKINVKFIQSIQIDTLVGMIFSQIGAWSIIVVGATVMHQNGITDIASAADAAKALEPLVQSFPNSGYLAKLLFATGIIGLGFLSVPVLAGSAAYALSEAMNWKEGLNLKLSRARGFYGVITVATLLGLLMNFIGINPVKALIYTAVINGIVAAPLIFVIWLIARDEKIMGQYKSGRLSSALLGLTFTCMTIAGIALIMTFFKG